MMSKRVIHKKKAFLGPHEVYIGFTGYNCIPKVTYRWLSFYGELYSPPVLTLYSETHPVATVGSLRALVDGSAATGSRMK